MDNYTSLVIGVIGGIITAAVIQLLVFLFDKVLLPWYRQLIYHGVEIQGKWEETLDFNNGNTQIMTVELSQRAHVITGHVTNVKSTNGTITKSEMMLLKGTVKDRLFNGTIVPVDQKRLGVAVVLLEIVGDGSRMLGASCWYDTKAAKISNVSVMWKRI